MKLTGPVCTEALSGAEEAGSRERAEGNAGGVRVERRVRANSSEMIMNDFIQTLNWKTSNGKDHFGSELNQVRPEKFGLY